MKFINKNSSGDGASRIWRTLFLLLLFGNCVLGMYFVLPEHTGTSDDRQTVRLAPSERDLVLSEMRGLLQSLHRTIASYNEGNFSQAAADARSAGMEVALRVGGEHPAIIRKLPLEMRKMGFGTHESFDNLARRLESGMSPADLLTEIRQLTGRCVACHAAYRIETRGDD